MPDNKKKKPAPFVGYGANIKQGKAITKSVKKNVVSGVTKAGKAYGRTGVWPDANLRALDKIATWKNSKSLYQKTAYETVFGKASTSKVKTKPSAKIKKK